MYAVRGSWVGQTFALAASNSSGERKSRIRRSKEERKALAESFINRYQSLNEGNFPSLNLTHKEVGGSFYTVREIVREIIQENKVLGPAKNTSEVNEDDTIAHNYPLGSISMEPQDFLLQSQNGTNVVSNLEEVNVKQTIGDNENLEVYLDSNGQCCNENEPHNSKSTDVIDTIRSSNESDNLLVEQPVNEKSEVDGKLGVVGTYNAKLTLPTEEVEVETFPLRPTIKEANEEGSISITSIDSNILNHNKEVDLESQSLGKSESLLVEKDSPLLIDGHMGQVAPNSDLRMRTAEVSKELDGFQGTASGEKSTDTTSTNASKESLFTAANEYDASILDQSKRGISPTLDRINLESWQKTSKQGTNPISAFFKTLKDAFVKFWSA